MKAVIIAFNQANSEKVEFILDHHEIRGYTWWNDVQGRGTQTGEPRKGTHTWPEMNSAAMVVIPDEKVDLLLESIKMLDEINQEVGIRAFVLNVEQSC
ncbi:MAG: PG0541 family transporter-associated protein [Bacteroidales bacterium]